MRLALREEGSLWVAYCAKADTMDDALFLGSIRRRFVDNPVHKAIFMGLMQDAVGDLIEEASGQRPTWPYAAQAAPESERGGNG
jgi:hypothetical protein